MTAPEDTTLAQARRLLHLVCDWYESQNSLDALHVIVERIEQFLARPQTESGTAPRVLVEVRGGVAVVAGLSPGVGEPEVFIMDWDEFDQTDVTDYDFDYAPDWALDLMEEDSREILLEARSLAVSLLSGDRPEDRPEPPETLHHPGGVHP